jgi:hypothetical protein
MRVRRIIPLSDAKSGLIPALNYVLGAPSDSKSGIPFSVNVDITPRLQETVLYSFGALSVAIVASALIRK